MAIRPKNLTPQTNMVRKPDDKNVRFGHLINSPTLPEFGGAAAVDRIVKRAPYGRITHVGRKGSGV